MNEREKVKINSTGDGKIAVGGVLNDSQREALGTITPSADDILNNMEEYNQELEETYDNLNGREQNIIKCESAQECVDRSDVVVFMHPNRKYSTLEVKGKTLVDIWGIFSPSPPVVSLSAEIVDINL